MNNSSIIIPPLSAIGQIFTPFQQAQGTPIQSSGANQAEGVVELFPEYAAGLKDIEGFERLWLIYCLDRVSEPKLLVRPFLDTVDHGVFATRSPARPNRLGLSPVRLLRVEGARLHVADVDMLDGTPLVDIKPYIPDFDCFDVKRAGWYAGKSAKGVVADSRFSKNEK
jgi:tRNA-Thr(GGU) m(6)t(6)A37 methyltransferase TsaA